MAVDIFDDLGIDMAEAGTTSLPLPSGPPEGVGTSVSEPSATKPAPAWMANLQKRREPVDIFDDLGIDAAAASAEPRERPWTYRYNVDKPKPGDTFLEGVTYYPRSIFKSVADVGAIATKGARDLAVGIATLPGDVAEYAGLEEGKDVSDFIRRNVPDIEFTTEDRSGGKLMSDLSSELVQYGVPAAGASKWAEKLLRSAPKVARWAGQLTAAVGADIAAAGDEDTQTLGNLLDGGPTAIRPDDAAMERRLKVGAEAGALYTILTPAIELIRHGGPFLGRMLKTMGAPEEMADTIVAQTMQDAAEHGADVAAARLMATVDDLDQGGFKVTTGTGSDDPGLIALERGLATTSGERAGYRPSVKLAQRKRENKAAAREQVESVTQREGRPGQATEFFDQDRAARLAATEEEAAQRTGQAQASVEEAETAARQAETELEAARAEVDEIVGEQTARGKGRTAASEQIDATAREELARLTAEKNRLARSIDPDRSVVVDKAPLREAVNDVLNPKGPLDATVDDLPADLMRRLRRAVARPKKGRPETDLTFADIQDLRPALSAKIAAARKEDQGHVVEALLKIRDAMDSYTDDVARGHFGVKAETAGGKAAVESVETTRQAAAAAAERFKTFYRETFAPRFKEGVGADVRMGIKSRKPVRPSAMGRTFIHPNTGSKEAAQDLRRIAEGAKDPAQAAERVRNYVIADFANWAVDSTGKINRRGIFEYLRRHKDVLDQFPDLQRQIKAMARRGLKASDRIGEAEAGVKAAERGVKQAESALKKEVDAAAKRLDQTADEYKRSVAGYFIDADPVKAMGRVMTSEKPDEAMAELLKRTQGNKEARDGLSSALGEWVNRRIRAMDEAENVKLNKVQELLGDKRMVRALEMLHGRKDVAVLKRVRNQLQTANRINEQVTAGSPTASLRESTKIISLALDLKFGIMRGRRYLNAMSWLSDQLHSEKLEARVLRLLTEAMLDPEKARVLLLGRRNKEARRKALEWMGKEVKRTRTGGQLLSQPPAEE